MAKYRLTENETGTLLMALMVARNALDAQATQAMLVGNTDAANYFDRKAQHVQELVELADSVDIDRVTVRYTS